MKMNHALLITLTGLCMGLTACSDKSSNNAPAPAAVSPAAETTTEVSTALPVSGAKMAESTVSGRSVVAGQSSTGGPSMTLEEILAAYPTLADRSAFLSTIDRVVETDARTFDLYAGNVLVLSLAHGTDANSLVVSQSSNGFAADKITYAMTGNAQDQSEAVESMYFQVSACKAGEQDQDQNQGKGKEPPKVEDVCYSIEATLTLQKVVQKPEDQDQGKGGKDDDQGQDQPKKP